LFPLFATGVNDTSSTNGKFTGGVIDNGGLPVSLIPVENLPQM
jgi:hypothetical protein